jgi:glycosyltransferase involved in cell wall biosynthesis
MNKSVVFQSPAFMYEVVPPFYKELNKLDYFDNFYLATDKDEPFGLGQNVKVMKLKEDLGWEGNLKKLLKNVSEDFFVFMCDDHVAVQQQTLNLDPLFEVMQRNTKLGRLQLSPPTRNYAMFLKAHGLPIIIPDDSKSFYPYDKRYRFHLNFQPSIWRKEFLHDVITGGGNKSQLEIRASERARRNTKYYSAYIGHYALRFENFFASCQMHHTDPEFHKRKKKPHYREEFVAYAIFHQVQLDSAKRVHVRRQGWSASVPVEYYIKYYKDQRRYQRYAISRGPIGDMLWKLKKRVKANLAPYVAASSR